jgi:tetratricopeptide (TPR) repeat protein
MNLMGTESGTRRHVGEKFCWYHALIPCAVFLFTLLAFLPSLQNGFVDWDDYDNFLKNPYYRGLSWEHLHWMFTTVLMSNYRPLTWATFGFDYILWGMNPFGYHLTSLLLHGFSALLFYFLTLRLLSLSRSSSVAAASEDVSPRIAAGFAALVFSIHPLRVEPVAWLSARNHLLAALFFLWTIVCYLRVAAQGNAHLPRWNWLATAIILYGLSLLAQTSGITLPLVLLMLDVYPLRRLGGGPGKWFGREARRVWWETVPFLFLALGAALIGVLSKHQVLFSFEDLGPLSRLGQVVYGLAFYGWKTIVPVGLSPLYQLPFHFDPWDWPFLVGGLAVLVASTVLFVARHRWPAGLAAWLFYVVNLIPYVAFLVPVLGSLENGPQVNPDRYSYIACLPWAILAGAGALSVWRVWLSEHGGFRTLALASVPVVAIVAALVTLTWKQTQVWRDTETLMRQAVEVTDKSHFKSLAAHYNLANSLRKRGQLDEAAEHYRVALQLNPAFPETHNNLGLVLAQKNDLVGAREHFQAAIKLNPKYSEPRANLGNVLAMQGDLTGAIREYREALKVSPNLDGARFQVAILLTKLNHIDEAKSEFQAYLKRQPDSVEAHYFLGTIYFARREFQKGTDEMGTALKLRPDFADAHITLARALRLQGKLDEASQHYQQALGILNAQRESQKLR